LSMVAMLSVVNTAPVFGQASATGSLAGVVKDPSGGVLPGVTESYVNDWINTPKSAHYNGLRCATL
jgi:hypothetical protein